MLTTATVHWPLGQAPCIVMHTEILTFPKLERVLGADLKEKQYKSKRPMAEK